MYIWLINHYAVPPEYYPLARQTYFAKNLMDMGHKVTIISASSVHNSNINLITDGNKWKRETINGVDHVYIKCCNYNGNGLRRIYNMCEFAWKLPGVCKHIEKPDAIVSTSMPPMSCARGIKIAKKYGVIGVAEIADLWPESIVLYGIAKANNPAVKYLRRLEKWIYTNADSVVFTMEGAYEYISEQGWKKEVSKSKVFYINNGVDLKLFDYNRDHYQIDDEDLKLPTLFKVIYTGSIRKVNNLGRLLDAAKLVENKRIIFLIWGNGDELDILKKRVRDEEIKNVKFKGNVEKKFVPYIISCADLNIMHGDNSPILKYGLSANKLFDYFAAGKPVLTDFECKYNPATKYELGPNLKEYTARGIAKEIELLSEMDENALRLYGDNARKAAADYDFKILSKRLLKVIQRKRG